MICLCGRARAGAIGLKQGKDATQAGPERMETWVAAAGLAGRVRLSPLAPANGPAGRPNPAAHTRDLENHYHIRCPDVLRLAVAGRPDLSGPRPVGIDGQVSFGANSRVAADGQTPPQIARAAARQLAARQAR